MRLLWVRPVDSGHIGYNLTIRMEGTGAGPLAFRGKMSCDTYSMKCVQWDGG